jgi:hypothetical protein
MTMGRPIDGKARPSPNGCSWGLGGLPGCFKPAIGQAWAPLLAQARQAQGSGALNCEPYVTEHAT